MPVAGIICKRCGEPTPRRGQQQKYCPECSGKVDRARKTEWQSRHQPTPAKAREYGRKQQSDIARNGRASSAKPAGAGVDMTRVVDPEVLIRVAVPFDYSASKNAIYSFGGPDGHVFKREKSNAFRQLLILALRRACANAGHPFKQNKVWLDIFVQKPDHKGDAVNVVDLVCDAVKVAINVDDRWFSIRKLDWEICKTDPKLVIGVAQEQCEHAQVCSYCGHIKPLSEFWKSKNMKSGVTRTCKKCGMAAATPDGQMTLAVDQ